LPDDVIDGNPPALGQLISVHERFQGSVLAVREVEPEAVERFGVVDGEPIAGEPATQRVRGLVEKPAAAAAPSRWAIFGRYVLVPEIFEILARTPAGAIGEVQLTDGLRVLLHSQPVYAHAFSGDLYDCGTKLGLLQTAIALALRRPDLREPLLAYLDRLSQPSPSRG
jgi:UTP--glucose-1-phosphate uridylyltransferase